MYAVVGQTSEGNGSQAAQSPRSEEATDNESRPNANADPDEADGFGASWSEDAQQRAEVRRQMVSAAANSSNSRQNYGAVSSQSAQAEQEDDEDRE